MALPTPDTLAPGAALGVLRNVTSIDGASGDRAVVDGTVSTAVDDIAGSDGVDAGGWLLLPPLADMHAHIDKAYTWEMAGRPAGSLEDAVACWQRFGAGLSERQIATHARRALMAALRAGVTTMRTHVNFHEGADPLRGLRAVVALREEFSGLVDLQVVAMHGHLHESALVREAIALGADLLGGAPHLSPDPVAEMDRTVALAEEAGIGVDLHTDETLDPHSLDIVYLSRITAHWPADRTRSAGHCVSLAVQPREALDEILGTAAAAGVSIITNPLTNLYLQGWEHHVATPRAIPPLHAIRAAGVALAAGGDNVQDPFNPLGNGDMVDVAAALVIAGHLSPAEAWQVASAGRSLLGLPPAAGEHGDIADMLLVRASSVAEALAERAPDRVVVRAGRVVATRRLSTAVVDIDTYSAKEITV
ncbi:amidohydrolase family protein [Microbacterium aquimaris]|uniref:Amidohydrolase family protein n=1 Tax=Microbacterium aquimaris TaxID=459816 RepID=A0ABU5N5V4_9MICO|nr:amidohydrolase family protein [Microbacterium aquimaris]MDZ8161463.1 amidohydrolase family protein [Microbacterium aquimaris]